MSMNVSHLIEPTVKYYLFNTLQSCHSNRVTIYYYVLNIGVFLLFAGITGYILYYCYTHKLSPYEKQKKMLLLDKENPHTHHIECTTRHITAHHA
jgi:hypothetical protein